MVPLTFSGKNGILHFVNLIIVMSDRLKTDGKPVPFEDQPEIPDMGTIARVPEGPLPSILDLKKRVKDAVQNRPSPFEVAAELEKFAAREREREVREVKETEIIKDLQVGGIDKTDSTKEYYDHGFPEILTPEQEMVAKVAEAAIDSLHDAKEEK